ncbi:hypothetical protein BG011_005780 [Mortierella polycephala]|uniref:Uncharacterized protein n=1 Tax=Mortierella polycephala TaxID=41804 RepID=A0A9P6PVA2_9FUNG|nr:hypothetical protein BG011_005780 [Mortierella polycephala]
MKAFMDDKDARSLRDQGKNSLSDHIDMGVYSKNRGIRILGSCKRADLSRRFVRASWHQASVCAQDAEFFTTNVQANSTKVANLPTVNKLAQVQC